jgi:hypothetical protein
VQSYDFNLDYQLILGDFLKKQRTNAKFGGQNKFFRTFVGSILWRTGKK